METSLFYGIPLKDLNPINVEIDDIGVYSRRSMYKIRDTYPVSIRRQLFAILERLQLNSREFNERDKECEAMKERRRNEIRNARMRKKLRKYIGTEVKIKKVEIQGPNPFDTQGGITEKDWLPVVRAQVDDDDDDDELGLPYRGMTSFRNRKYAHSRSRYYPRY
ncbi:unnamed protein product [Cylicostephanus goldi]|uniref:Uncharacterized protein n=1 Tax=Cylicostephanus goldi TaxID=71465 RepID=A0A3P6RBP4_CYLGO|nr:unnamed protein product [Cylicostephanus goldi]